MHLGSYALLLSNTSQDLAGIFAATNGTPLPTDGLAPEDQSAESRAGRIAFWRDGTIGNGNRHSMPNEPGCVELTPLGRKIAQIDPWVPAEAARL